MSVQISDCTIRDGGYLTGKMFPDEFVNGVIDGLVKSHIDYIETGFLQIKSGGEPIVYMDSRGVRKYIPAVKGDTEFVGFCDNSRYSNDLLDECDHKSFESLRISFAKHEWRDAIKFCSAAKEKGYHVFVQPMDAPGYSMEERAELIAEVNKIMPEAFAIVDTFGTMHLHDLTEIFKQVDSLLAKGIKVGLHSHNNLNLSVALVETLVNLADGAGRDVAVDGSLFGMGRGAGNANTEDIANFLNLKFGQKYDVPQLIGTIEKYILPLRKTIRWGYDMPMFVCGALKSHVDNVYYLQKNANCNARELFEVIGSVDPALRKRYGNGYSKGDFSLLQAAYNNFKNNK